MLIRVIEAQPDEDLGVFSAFLRSNGVAHRVYLEGQAQILELADQRYAAAVKELYGRWQAGDLQLEHASAPPRAAGLPFWRRSPNVSVLMGLCLLGFAASFFPAWAALLQIAPNSGAVPELWLTQPWRLLTPMFLHYSWFHVGFNVALGYEFGRRLETALSVGAFWLIVLLLALLANLAQFYWGGQVTFGGLSGVVYGLLGFLLMAQRREPTRAAWHLPPAFSGSLLFFLVLFSTGITEPYGFAVANAAHWGGFVAGLLCGWLWPLASTAER